MPSRACTTRSTHLIPSASRKICASALLFACLFATLACNQVNNPWKDSGAAVNADMTTANAEVYKKNGAKDVSPPQRNWQESRFTYATGETTHWPTWFSDPFNDKGNGETADGDTEVIDTQFAWNWADYLHMGYGPGRWLLNIGAFPVSAVVDWPGKVMASDGRLSPSLIGRHDHDARHVAMEEVDPPDVVTVHDGGATDVPAESETTAPAAHSATPSSGSPSYMEMKE